MNSIGIYGIGVMGRGLALNLASKGHRVAIYNKEVHRITDVMNDARSMGIHTMIGYETVREFMKSLTSPRKVLMMVPAGRPVCDVIDSMSPYLKRGDILIDGGNEWYQETQERQLVVRYRYGAELIGMGVSGGAYGAQYGAAFMPGGARHAVDAILPMLRDISHPSSLVNYVGSGGSGHYVKTVHNGIEYAVMQTIAEIYGVLRTVCGLSNIDIASCFRECNRSHDLNSYLLDITANILDTADEDGTPLIDKILDVPRMNGTGTWTAREAFDALVPCPSITAAIDARIIASEKTMRIELSKLATRLRGSQHVEQDVSDILMVAMHMAYLQGFQLIKTKSDKEGWNVNVNLLAKNWMGGCIIKSNILRFFANTDPTSYTYDSFLKFQNTVPHLAAFVSDCVLNGVHTPVIAATYQYMIGYMTDRLPANLIQAQRDYFGSHGYERIDKAGKFHTNWKL